MRRLILSFVAVAAAVSATAADPPDVPPADVSALLDYLPLLKVLAQERPILAFDSRECPSGWDRFEPAGGRFLRGANGTDVPFGIVTDASSHGHTTEGNVAIIRKDNDSSDSAVARAGHQHQVAEANHIPPSISVSFCTPER